MRNKKLLSTILAATLAATTMAMPVMAAQRGSVDVTVEDAKGVLRVQVPTTLAVKIDPYEIVEQGSQIASTEFGMSNRSQMDVKVVMDSKITKAASGDLSFVSSKDAATTSTTKGQAWVAIAAMTSGDPTAPGTNPYDDLETSGDPEEVATLTEANTNVTTFSASGDASQTYYLAKSANTTLTTTYHKVVPAENGKPGTDYAEYYELAPVTFTTTGASGDAELKTQLATKDIYRVPSGDASNEFEKYTKDDIATISGKVASGDAFYAISGDAKIQKDATVAGTTYMYEEVDQGGTAGFRYIGKLSNAGSKEWSKDDFGVITLNYTISGVSRTDYEAVEEQCVNGFYKGESGPKMSLSSTGYITITGLTAEKNYKSMDVDYDDGNIAVGEGTVWNTDDYDSDQGGDLGIQLSDAWRTWLSGQTITVNLTLSDDSQISASATLD